jgi:hypothetical protein
MMAKCCSLVFCWSSFLAIVLYMAGYQRSHWNRELIATNCTNVAFITTEECNGQMCYRLQCSFYYNVGTATHTQIRHFDQQFNHDTVDEQMISKCPNGHVWACYYFPSDQSTIYENPNPFKPDLYYTFSTSSFALMGLTGIGSIGCILGYEIRQYRHM